MIERIKASKNFYIFYRAFGRYKGRIAVMVVLGFLGGLFESVSISAMIPLFSLIAGGSVHASDNF